jgi:tetratricopeptide (TPR) repeat protein
VSIEQAQHFAEQSALSLQAGQPSLALDLAEQALQLVPTSGDAENLRAIALSQTGQPRGAEDAFKHAADLMPGSAKPLYNLGVHLYAAGKKREALVWLAKALEREPSHAAAFALQKTILGQGIRIDASSPATGSINAPFQLREQPSWIDERRQPWILAGWLLTAISFTGFALAVLQTMGEDDSISWPAALLLLASFGLGVVYILVDIARTKRNGLWAIAFALLGCPVGWLVLPIFILTAPKRRGNNTRPSSMSDD